MSQFLSPKSVAMIERIFLKVRQDFSLGVDELKAALDAVEDFPRDQPDEVKHVFQILRLLWCHSPEDRERIAEIEEVTLQAVAAENRSAAATERTMDDSSIDRVGREAESLSDPAVDPRDRASQSQGDRQSSQSSALTPYPTQVPPPARTDDGGPVDWESRYYAPLNRRVLAYNWRYLRRFRADGAMDLLDVGATVQLAASQGTFLGPVFRRREVNHVRLLVLVDQLGSMVPFHRYSRDVIETLGEDAQLEDWAVYYFQNVPGKVLYRNEKLTQAVPIEDVLLFCDRGTSVLILSDAGAARRSQIEMKRVRATLEWLEEVRQRTALIAWLNPVPMERWSDTSAEMVARLVPMVAMDRVGLSDAIDQLCGKARRRVRGGGRS
jgi:uncharacterized protein